MADRGEGGTMANPESTSQKATALADEPVVTILVVDDELALGRVAARILSRHGYRVLIARDGQDALEMLTGDVGVAVVVTDVMMPRMGGRELASLVRARSPGTGIVFMSGYAKEDPFTSGLGDGTVLYLSKPFRSAELLHAVKAALSAAVV